MKFDCDIFFNQFFFLNTEPKWDAQPYKKSKPSLSKGDHKLDVFIFIYYILSYLILF